MQFKATLANILWTASNVPAYARFRRALGEARRVQQLKLREILSKNVATAFGKAHGLERISSYEEFARQVPLSDYATLEPWISRIRQGEQNVLTSEPVTHLIPTSGSSGARKLIPFTAGLQHEFNAAIGPWLVDLTRQFPALMSGPAYWSITPAFESAEEEDSAVPIGFAADTSYLGGARRRLADILMAVPSGLGQAKSLAEFRYQTLLHLLLCRELRLISVWHPSFLTLLLDALPVCWAELLRDIERGTNSTVARPQRAEELRGINPLEAENLWPALQLVSCWGNGAARFAFQELRRRFPTVFLQPKGLIATEAFVTLPFEGRYPLAVGSHFFEFIDEGGRLRGLQALQERQEYEVVITNAGGLWRYQMGDRVRVIGWLGETPCLEFLGRGESVSDICGEKLSEPFVAAALSEVFGEDVPRFVLLAPERDQQGCYYTLFVEGMIKPNSVQGLERALCRNLHYAYCRKLEQLLPLRTFIIAERGYETFARRKSLGRARLGSVKPAVLSRDFGWTKIFSGAYLGNDPLPARQEKANTSLEEWLQRQGSNLQLSG